MSASCVPLSANTFPLQAEIIAIGDEILIGQTIDTNSAFIATHLNLNGIIVKQKKVIADDAQTIIEALNNLLPATKLVFMTGGLGPTKDDITKQTLTEYFGGELAYHEEVYRHIEQLFASFNRVPSESNRGQAYLPTSCTPILNEMGTAPGMHFTKNGVHFFSTPGVPYETEHLVEKKIIPWIQQNLQKGTVVHRTILTIGVGESDLADQLSDFENHLPRAVKLAYLPSPGMVKLRLSCYEGEVASANKLINNEAEKIYRILGDIIFGEGNAPLEEVVGGLLKEKGITLATAESCTGGNIAKLITTIPGSSAYFIGGVVAYSNEVKVSQLGVKRETLENFGAVSEQTIKEMAVGVRKTLNTDYGVATSGIAGPDGGTNEKPVGTVWIAIAGPNGVDAQKFRFGNRRKHNIWRASLKALDMLRKEIEKIK